MKIKKYRKPNSNIKHRTRKPTQTELDLAKAGTLIFRAPDLSKSFLPIKIKDFGRRWIFSNRELGRYVPYKDSLGWHPDINGKGFGKVIGEGSEQTVYENLDNPNEVFKMLDISYPTKEALRAGVKLYNKRNLIPLQERTKFIGYVKGLNNAGTQEAYYPIFSLKKLTLPSENYYSGWLTEHLPHIEETLKQYGITKGEGWNTYNYGKLKLSDLSPDNIGFDENGNLRFIDIYVEKQGGQLRLFYNNANNFNLV